jgi:hypothetical protein
LLALVTDALLAQGLAIQSARAFCRVVARDRDEAVDFLELRAPGGPDGVAAQLDGDGLQAFAQSLSELVVEDMAQRPTSSPPRAAKPATRVYFERMRIIACEIRTVEGRARDRFEVEPSSQRTLSDGELCDVQFAVLDALMSRH